MSAARMEAVPKRTEVDFCPANPTFCPVIQESQVIQLFLFQCNRRKILLPDPFKAFSIEIEIFIESIIGQGGWNS